MLIRSANHSNNGCPPESNLEEYKDVFQGLGDIGSYTIELKDEAKPKQDAPRSVPVALRKELKQRLNEMESQGILKKEIEPTEWVNSAVYVKKPGKKIIENLFGSTRTEQVCENSQASHAYIR